MAYTYTPYEYQSAIGSRPRFDDYEGQWSTNETGPQWDLRKTEDQRSQFQDYAGDQFKGLFDIVNQVNTKPDPLASLSAAPRYNPYSGTRDDFTTPGGYTFDEDSREIPFGPSFDQQGYLDARFGNINDYLSNLGSFFGNISTKSGTNERVQQDAMARANYAANLPQAGSLGNIGGVPQVGGLSGFAQATPGSNYGGWGGRQVSGGWGSHPVAGGLLGFGGE